MKNSTFLKDLFAIDKANDELFRLVGVAIRLFIISRFLCLNYCAD